MTNDEQPVADSASGDKFKYPDRDRADRFIIIDEMRSAFVGVSPDEIEREAARALTEVREDMRCEAQRASLESS